MVSVADQDPESGAFLPPGIRDELFPLLSVKNPLKQGKSHFSSFFLLFILDPG
jgi:hypothetical protein